ncbi:MAG: RNA polymerase sigma factor [Phycisphaerales bacterium JB040]
MLHRLTDSTRSSLLRRAGSADEEAWRELVDTYWRVIYGYARKNGLTHEECEDLVQQVMIEMTNLLPGFEYDRERGRFRGLLKAIVRRRIADHLRKTRRDGSVPPPGHAGAPDRAADSPADDSWEQVWRTGVLRLAMERAASQVEPVTFQAFQLATINRVPAREVAEMLGISVDSVYAARSRVAHRIRIIFDLISREGERDADSE